MPKYDLFSSREKKRQNVGKPEVFQYDDLPGSFRVQVVHILNDAIASGYPQAHESGLWEAIRSIIIREKGLFSLAKAREVDRDCIDYILKADALDVLDLIEVAFRAIDVIVREWYDYKRDFAGIKLAPDDAIEELNHRFRESAIGYRYEATEIIRVDSLYLHAEAVVPALALLSEPGFQGPNDEFLTAHEHYRRGQHEAALTEALKAFESTMKAICDKREWEYVSDKATAKDLIEVIFKNNLIPSYLQSEVTGVRTTLQCGVPTLRNKSGGHGAGATPRDVPGYFASYALHLTAANIVLLVEAHKAMK